MEMLTIKEVAAMLKISHRHIYELANLRTKAGDVRKHPLPCYRLGAAVRFDRAEVEQWVSTCR